ncbi:MAG TPA: thioredoxin family protein, partial [Planctomycetota bacterium]|nr:thioredoxin family protein [Planctomycetota bacterium]
AAPTSRTAKPAEPRPASAPAADKKSPVALAREKYGPIYKPDADAVADIAAGVAKAKSEGRHVIVEVGGNWCPWCYLLHDTIESTPELKETIEKSYVVVRVSVDQKVRNEAALAQLGHPERFGYPVLVVLDGEGRRLHTQDSGLLEKGDRHEIARVAAFLRGWTPDAVAGKTEKH